MNVFSSDFSGLPCLLQLILSYICWIAVNFATLKDRSLLINIFASNNCLSDRNIFRKGVDALSKIDNAFAKTKHFTLFGLSDYVQILLDCGIKTMELQMEFQTSCVSICNGNKKYPSGTSILLHRFCVPALSCFHCCC